MKIRGDYEKKLRKIVKILFSITVTWIVAICSIRGVDNKAEYVSKQIVHYINNADKAGLASLFCEEMRVLYDMEHEMDEMLTVLDGKIVSHQHIMHLMMTKEK